MTLFSGVHARLLNVSQACSRMAPTLSCWSPCTAVGFCFITTAKACQGTGVSGWERANVWDWIWARVRVEVGNLLPLTFTRVRISVSVSVTLTLVLTLKWGGLRAKVGKSYGWSSG